MASKYDLKTRERVIRVFRERGCEAPEESGTASFRRVNELTGIPVDTMRGFSEVRCGRCRPGPGGYQ